MIRPLLIVVAVLWLLALDIRELFSTPRDALRSVGIFSAISLFGAVTTSFLPGAAGLAGLAGASLAAIDLSNASQRRREWADLRIAGSESPAEVILWLDGRIDAVRGRRGVFRLSVTIAVGLALLAVAFVLLLAASLESSTTLALLALGVALIPSLQLSRFLLEREELTYLQQRRMPFLAR